MNELELKIKEMIIQYKSYNINIIVFCLMSGYLFWILKDESHPLYENKKRTPA